MCLMPHLCDKGLLNRTFYGTTEGSFGGGGACPELVGDQMHLRSWDDGASFCLSEGPRVPGVWFWWLPLVQVSGVGKHTHTHTHSSIENSTGTRMHAIIPQRGLDWINVCPRCPCLHLLSLCQLMFAPNQPLGSFPLNTQPNSFSLLPFIECFYYTALCCKSAGSNTTG